MGVDACAAGADLGTMTDESAGAMLSLDWLAWRGGKIAEARPAPDVGAAPPSWARTD